MKCQACGAEIEQTARFCSACGATTQHKSPEGTKLSSKRDRQDFLAGYRLVATVAAAVAAVTLGIFALSRHGQAVSLENQADAATRHGDYAGAIACLEQAHAAWPLGSVDAAIARNKMLLASNTYFLRGSVAFRAKQWAIAVKYLEAIVAGNIHYSLAQTMLTTAQQRRSQRVVAVQFMQAWSNFQAQLNALATDYSTEANYVNGAWNLFDNGLTPSSPSLVHAVAFMPAVQADYVRVDSAAASLGTMVGDLKSAGLSSNALESLYSRVTGAVAALNDQSDAISNELSNMQGDASGRSDYYSATNSDIGETNSDLTTSQRDLSVAGSDESEFVGTLVSRLGPLPGYSGAQSSA